MSLLDLIPEKYTGQVLIIGGMIIIIIGIIMWFDLYNILVQCCLIIGLSGIYTRKTKNFGSVRKSEEKEGIEHKRLNRFYVITIVGIFFNILLFSIYISFHIVFLFSLGMYISGYPVFIIGLLFLYFKKKKA